MTCDSILNLLLGQQLFVPLQQQLYMHEQSRAQFRRRLKVLTHPLQEVKGQSLPETTTCTWPFQPQISRRWFFACLEMRDHTCSLPRAVLLCSSTPPEEPHSPVALTALTWEGTCLEGTHLWGRKHTMHKLQFLQRYQAHQTLLPHLGCGF